MSALTPNTPEAAAFLAQLEIVFHDTFLESAPLYVASHKVKLPHEDLKTTVTLYKGALTTETRTVDLIADYRISKTVQGEVGHAAASLESVRELAINAGAGVDGLIRLENTRSRDGSDPRDTKSMYVSDIFQHADGRRNLNLMYVNSVPSVSDPNATIAGWIAYRFYFAAAHINHDYKEKNSVQPRLAGAV